MSGLENNTNFCLFCYKSTQNSFLETDEILESIKRFTKIVNRFTNLTDADQSSCVAEDKLVIILNDNDKLLKYCSKCNNIIVEIYEIYDQMKTLELQLDFKLDGLVRKINFANKVPSRWLNLNKALEECFQNDAKKKIDLQEDIRGFRQNVVKAAQHRKRNSQPRVSLKRSNNLVELPTLPDDTDVNDDNHIGPHEGQMSSMDHLPEEMQTNEETDSDGVEEVESNTAFAHPFVQVKVEPTDFIDDNHQSGDESSLINLYPTAENDIPDANKTCPKCGKKLKTNFALKIHLESHKSPEEWKWKCEDCGKRFYDRSNFKRHSKIHTKVLNNQLEKVHGKDKNIDEEVNRMETENTTGSYLSKCLANSRGSISTESEPIVIKKEPVAIFSDIGESNLDNDNVDDTEEWWENVSTVSSSVQHIDTKVTKVELMASEKKQRPAPSARQSSSTSSKPDSECKVCKRKFKGSSQKVLVRHYKLFHDLQGKPEGTETFKCVIENCAAYFLKNTQLIHHYNDEHQISRYFEPADYSKTEYRCRKCGRKFIGRPSFLDHTRLYRWKSCRNFEFLVLRHKKERERRERMNRIENGEEVAEAEDDVELTEACQDKEGDSKPTKVEKIRKEKRRLECPTCKKVFEYKSHFDLHLLSHKDRSEWEFECGKCGKKWMTNGQLKAHMKVHSWKNSRYNCKICGKKFGSGKTLKNHLRASHGDGVEVKADGKRNKLEKKVMEWSSVEMKEDYGDDLVKTEQICENIEMEDESVNVLNENANMNANVEETDNNCDDAIMTDNPFCRKKESFGNGSFFQLGDLD